MVSFFQLGNHNDELIISERSNLWNFYFLEHIAEIRLYTVPSRLGYAVKRVLKSASNEHKMLVVLSSNR